MEKEPETPAIDDNERARRLVLILGDQLTPGIAALKTAAPERDIVLMAEVEDEATYVAHHKKKIAFVFSAMRHFAAELADLGWRVDYVKLDADGNSGSIPGEIRRALTRHQSDEVLATEPGEWRLRQELDELGPQLAVPLKVLEDDRFLCSHQRFETWATGRKSFRMENFYRLMRRTTGLLMDDGEPAGGKWNFDTDNRKPPTDDVSAIAPPAFSPDETTSEVLELVASRFSDNFGTLEPFWFAATRDDAEAAFERFVSNALRSFGDYQDAMLEDNPFLFHAVVSLYLNVGLLDPLECCRRVEAAYRTRAIPINAAEGFIRQVIGWREYVRGIYWLRMPEYVECNHLNARRPLPSLYWTGDTEMGCLASCVVQTRDEAFAHHIQRLMVLGNFAMLTGVDPAQVHEWYLCVYADAYEWVEAPNTIGMSQFADGGLLGSKPYAASGNYINRMSDYCASCRYDVKQKTGSDACPFNYLYWDFLARNRDVLKDNARLTMAYKTWDGMKTARQDTIRADAERFLDSLK